MVGLQAMVLGRLGMKARSSSKSVCSILPIAIYGPGLYGAPAFSCARIVSPDARPTLVVLWRVGGAEAATRDSRLLSRRARCYAAPVWHYTRRT